MAQGTALQKRLIAERAQSLALVLLTRREDLDIAESRADVGFDLLVTLRPGPKPGVRQFGVELWGRWPRLAADQATKVLQPRLQKLLRHAPFPYPVVVFVFTMEDDRGWYAWSAEPSVTDQGAELIQHGEPSCHPLDAQALDEIIDAVDRWYDAKYDASRPSPDLSRKRR